MNGTLSRADASRSAGALVLAPRLGRFGPEDGPPYAWSAYRRSGEVGRHLVRPHGPVGRRRVPVVGRRHRSCGVLTSRPPGKRPTPVLPRKVDHPPPRLECALRGVSSVGRAPALQAGGRRFEPGTLQRERAAFAALSLSSVSSASHESSPWSTDWSHPTPSDGLLALGPG